MIDLVRRTTWISIIVQVLTGVVILYALLRSGRMPIKSILLRDLLILEGSVQLVELIFYVYIVMTLNSHTSLKSMASKRYMDWVVTTPVMLITLAAYFTGKFDKSFGTFWKENAQRLVSMMAANELMMAFGLMGELGLLPMGLATLAGFLAFALAFRILYSFTTPSSRAIFWVVTVVWTIYGIAYMFPPVVKNTTYNFLDLVAKNFFGVYLSIQILKTL
jgi:bacteriorhodopsin